LNHPVGLIGLGRHISKSGSAVPIPEISPLPIKNPKSAIIIYQSLTQETRTDRIDDFRLMIVDF
jgi:hypothetical protein